MPTLIPELARAKAKLMHDRVEQLRSLKDDWDTLRQRVATRASVATQNIVDEAHEIQDLWSSAVKSLREGNSAEEQTKILRAFAELADSCRDYLDSVSRLWDLLVQMGGEAEGTQALVDAGAVLEQVRSEATRALEARVHPWQPSDRARFERGRQEIVEGRAVSPDEARARFRSNRGSA